MGSMAWDNFAVTGLFIFMEGDDFLDCRSGWRNENRVLFVGIAT